MLLLFLVSCNTTRHVPEGQYLLDEVEIKTTGKGVASDELQLYIKQLPNSSLPMLGKLRLKSYNVALMRKLFPRFVEKPVIFSGKSAAASAKQLELEVSNQGFLQAKVDTMVIRKGKKAKVRYLIHPDTLYRIRSYNVQIGDSTILQMYHRIGKQFSAKEGKPFSLKNLDADKATFTQFLRNQGYYNFSKDNFYYRADTTVGRRGVDVTLVLRPVFDSLGYRRYKIGKVSVLSGYDSSDELAQEVFRKLDTVRYKGVDMLYGRDHFLKPFTLYKNNFIRPGRWYADYLGSITQSSFGGLGAVKQTYIAFTETVERDSAFLDARITLPRANDHWWQTEIGGTNTAGDLGIAGSIGYRNQNLFNGAEELSVKLKGAYEFVRSGDASDGSAQNYYEYGAETTLTFPHILFPFLPDRIKEKPLASTQFGIGVTRQQRPEYERQFFNASVRYKWTEFVKGLTHSLDVLDVNYVQMPWVSDDFRLNYLENSRYPLLKYSYENQLIARTGYTLTFASSRHLSNRKSYVIRAGAEVAGLLPRLVSHLGGSTRNDAGYYQILGTRYAEYAKMDFDFADIKRMDATTNLAYHFAIGVAKPYGNSEILPFEKRYFSGGANSVRGWSTRRLGPGFYQPTKTSAEFAKQVGDIKLDMSIEWRKKMSEMFQLALFADAGNNWVIENNSSTPDGGLFKFSEFYKQIALSYGLGLRLDLNFLLLRFDMGVKAFDPGVDSSQRWRFRHTNLRDDFAFHFAIGYPF